MSFFSWTADSYTVDGADFIPMESIMSERTNTEAVEDREKIQINVTRQEEMTD